MNSPDVPQPGPSDVGTSPATVASSPVKTPEGRFGFLRRILPFHRKPALAIGMPDQEVARNEIKEQPVEVPINISTMLKSRIEELGLESPRFESMGASSFFDTNERINIDAMREVRNSPSHPNGYIVGVGVGNIFSLLECFPQGHPPKGIVLVNVDPAAIAEAQEFVDELKTERTKTMQTAKRATRWRNQSIPRAPSRAAKESNVRWEARVSRHNEAVQANTDKNNELIQQEYQRLLAQQEDHRPEEEYNELAYGSAQRATDPGWPIMRYRNILRDLAEKDAIVVLQQDILNPQVIETIKSLPAWEQSTNMVYLSNILDWWYRSHNLRITPTIREKLANIPVGTPEWGEKFDQIHKAEYAAINGELQQDIIPKIESFKASPDHPIYFAETLQGLAGGSKKYQLRVTPNNFPPMDISEFSWS